MTNIGQIFDLNDSIEAARRMKSWISSSECSGQRVYVVEDVDQRATPRLPGSIAGNDDAKAVLVPERNGKPEMRTTKVNGFASGTCRWRHDAPPLRHHAEVNSVFFALCTNVVRDTVMRCGSYAAIFWMRIQRSFIKCLSVVGKPIPSDPSLADRVMRQEGDG